MSMQTATRALNQPLGTSGDWRSRLLLHHAPLALASAVVLVLFMSLPPFDPRAYPQESMGTGVFPQAVPQRVDEGGQMDQGGGGQRRFMARVTTATGYVATGLLGLTLLIGPANLVLRRRNPISSYLTRDVGTWAASLSVVHVIFGLQLHGGPQVLSFLNYFVSRDGPLTNSFGLGNWTGLAALVMVVGLLAISNDADLRKLKARIWKNLQRLNYALFALVIAHAFFYGALLRLESPYTLLLLVSVIAVFVGQAVGVWLWRRRHFRAGATLAQQPSWRERQSAGATR